VARIGCANNCEWEVKKWVYLLSVNVALPRDISWRGETVHTSVWKDPVPGRRLVRRLKVDGDAQGDLAGHGGEHREVLVIRSIPTSNGNVNCAVRILRSGNSAKQQHSTEPGH